MGNTLTNDLLSCWIEEGNRLIPQNFEVFQSLIAQAKDFEQCGKYDMAAIYGDMAAEYASFMKHCGIFTSLELEHLFLTIGLKALKSSPYPIKGSPLNGMPKNILHVVSGVWSIGGHGRLLWRWIQQDDERSHSVVLIQQAVADTPKVLKDAVFKSHGKMYALNETIGSFIARSQQLREIAASFDMVVLHTIFDASIPTIAFANKEQSPPIIYVNHADERFWVGVGISDVVANLRESGMRLSQERRGIEEKRNEILPIVLSPTLRTLSRTEAKRELGFAEDSIIVLSIARAVKYKNSHGISFADAHVPFLKQHNMATLIVIGPGDSEDWSSAIAQTQGRIKVLGHTQHTSVFYQAADIYVDSFPFVSNTSLLEAGSYGIPLVSRYPYSSDGCAIFGADMPGLTDSLIRVQDLEEYTIVLSRLAEDKEFRLCLGEKTRKKIEETHLGINWKRSLENLYLRTTNLPRVTLTSELKDQIFLDEPDIFLEKVFPFTFDHDKLILDRVRSMPFSERFSIWLKQIKKGNFGRIGNVGFLLPEWLYRYLLKLAKLLPNFS
ncbi:MAG: glycosyltransferase [Dolichospermum lemmermannii FEM_B0920]|jgi:hypothetical protein